MPLGRYNAIFFSPHLDDAVLSAGNQLLSYAKQGKSALVVTIFTNGSQSNHPAASSFLRQSGFANAKQLFDHRKKEDRAAVQLLGADCLHLPFVDAGFRIDHPQTAQIFKSTLTRSDQQLTTTIQQTLSQILAKHATSDCHLFAPLAVGNHIDHEIIYEVMCRIWNPTNHWRLSFWEDVPYRHRTGDTCTRIAQISTQMYGLRPETIFTRSPQPKQAAVACYSSQISGLLSRGGYCQTFDNQIECYWHA